MKIYIVIASKESELSKTHIDKSLNRILSNPELPVVDIKFYGNNSDPVTKVYNKALNEIRQDKEGSIAVFIHGDLYINCFDFVDRLYEAAKRFTVFGVAGPSAITVKEPILWHIMGGRGNLHGCVAHSNTTEEYYYTSFGTLPHKTVMLDGVLIGIDMSKLPANLMFDESCPSRFHFYDLNFTLDCTLAKVSVGVVDIPIIHTSPGLREMTDEWKAGQQYFLTKYQKFLNKTLTVN